MLNRILNSKNMIHKTLDATWTRNETIAQNISNVDTPGYKRKIVSFEEQLKDALNSQTASRSDVSQVDIKVIEDKSTSTRMDGNNVNIDLEMAELAKNTIKYNALVEMANFSKIMTVLRNSKG